MKISISQPHSGKFNADLLVVPTTPSEIKALGKKNSKGAKGVLSLSVINHATQGLVAKCVDRQGFKAGAKDILSLPIQGDSGFDYLTLVGFGDEKGSELDAVDWYRKLGATAIASARGYHAKRVAILASDLDLKNGNNARALIEGALLGTYAFETYKAKKKESDFKGVEEIIILSKNADRRSLDEASVYSEATILARDLVNTPPNDCKPKDLVKKAKEIAKQGKLDIKVFERAELQKMGAGSLLAVSYGSDEPPYLVRMVLKPKKKATKVIGIVGKGITFDSGGLSIKTASGMEEMKMDMSGAAAVLGAMFALSKLNPRVEVRAYIPTTENMINGRATRPGDVAKAMSGKTIEILNTDAEGRLILADALCLAEKDGCETIVDLATLTGACVVALGSDYAGLFANDDKLAASLEKAGAISGERLWRMPLAKEYKRLIESSVADIKNTGGRYGGAITAALFLQEFVTGPKTKWAHLDIAGPAFADANSSYVKKGGVGFGVRTLVNFIRSI